MSFHCSICDKVVVARAGDACGRCQTVESHKTGNSDPKPGPVAKCEKITVTPHIMVEYLVVLRDRKLSTHQEGGEDKIVTDAVGVELWLEQDKESPKFDKGATLSLSGAGKADCYEDKELTKKVDLTKPLANDRLSGKTKLKLWLAGTAAGKCTLKLEAEKSDKTEFILAKPAEKEIGVVELLLQVHAQDQTELDKIEVDPDEDPIATYHTNLKNKALPPQKILSDEDKVKKGRLLHTQKDNHHGRARIVIKQLQADYCPVGSDPYDIVLNETNTSGAVEIFDAESAGTAQPLPLKIKLADLKTADKILWVQGKTATKKWRAARLDLGLDRADGGMKKTPKRNGDWARFTVVTIKEVKVDYTAPPDRAAAWDSTNKKFFINLKADWDSTNKKFTIDGNTDKNGRKITIGAQLSEKIAGVSIHFMLAPDKNNGKAANWGKDMPTTWKWKGIAGALKHDDKAARKKLLHLSATTDADGYAKKELILSRFGGDIFQPACYINEDPHLAKYVHGHTDLEKRKPVFAADQIKVWRKFWYQFTKADGFTPPQPAAAVTAYADVRAEMVLDQTISFKREASTPAVAGEKVAPARTFYKKYIIAGGNSEDWVANVGDYNKNAIANACYDPKSDQPVKNQLIVCSYQYDVKKSGNKRKATGKSAPITSDIHGSKIKITLDKPVFDPPLDGGSMVVELYWYRKSAPGAKTNIASAKATIPKPRANNREIEVEVPVITPAPAAGNASVFIVATCWSPWGPYLGESFGKHSLIVYDSADEADYNDTVVHEIGHALNQTPRTGTQPSPLVTPVTAGGGGIPDHPNQADRGQGNHCQVNDGVDATSGETKYKCVMYDSGPMQWGLHKYCATCHPYLLVENFSSFKDA